MCLKREDITHKVSSGQQSTPFICAFFGSEVAKRGREPSAFIPQISHRGNEFVYLACSVWSALSWSRTRTASDSGPCVFSRAELLVLYPWQRVASTACDSLRPGPLRGQVTAPPHPVPDIHLTSPGVTSTPRSSSSSASSSLRPLSFNAERSFASVPPGMGARCTTGGIWLAARVAKLRLEAVAKSRQFGDDASNRSGVRWFFRHGKTIVL
ncbi:hypothetical protein CDAR_300601 [Caerostris darwini]|uniref:Uncharacterized protein n=1 Tax=Caerostris darwini TaxID=1538125 RepID=A0AAV4RWC2_9ARAC|nr:hypothetical protein CDAR_300601 [Caerostris darwini]